jgi:hypothetical protein
MTVKVSQRMFPFHRFQRHTEIKKCICEAICVCYIGLGCSLNTDWMFAVLLEEHLLNTAMIPWYSAAS